MNDIRNLAHRSLRMFSFQNGILQTLNKATRLNGDPKIQSFGIMAGDTTRLGGARYGGRSSGCAFDTYNAYMSTVGETIERYCPSLFKVENMVKSSYVARDFDAVPPSAFSLFHAKQYSFFQNQGKQVIPFDENTSVYWDKCYDLTSGMDKFCPSTFIYLPWLKDKRPIFYGVSTGLAAHGNFHKAVLTALYEVIERDSFVLTWFQKIVPPKIYLTTEIKQYIKQNFPTDYEWHFFNITYDLEIPTIFGICTGESNYGPFIAVGTATRSTLGEAIKKTIQEIAQTIPYFRYILAKNKEWCPSDNFNEIIDFEQHSMFYVKRKDLQHVFDPWLEARPTFFVDINQTSIRNVKEEIKHITNILKKHSYNVLLKDLTTSDAIQSGMFCVRIIVPQLLQMTGAYQYYPLGGKRLYEVPLKMGYQANDFEHLNKYPHPFP